MKKPEIAEKDPIRDKYLKKVGFFKKIVMKFNDFKEMASKNYDFKGDLGALTGIVGDVVMYGVMGTLFLGLFGFSVSIGIILSVGCGLWLLENKFIEFITRILGSVKLIQINN